MVRERKIPSGEKACSQCTATKNDGSRRCSRRTCLYGPMCWQHTQTRKGLKIEKSTIPGAGLGLFTTDKKEFKKNEKIDEYSGEVISKKELDNRYPGKETLAPYAIALKRHRNNTKYVDAIKSNSGMVRYANNCRSKKDRPHCTGNNATLKDNNSQPNPSQRKPVLKATRTIKSNTEILTSYGRNYWPRTNIRR